MIKSLRRRFTAIAMCVTFAVLTLLMGVVNIANYAETVKSANALLDRLESFGGEFPTPQGKMFSDGTLSEDTEDAEDEFEEQYEIDEPKKPMGEFPFGNDNLGAHMDTRYFTVTLNSDGSVGLVNVKNIMTVTSDEAEAYAAQLFKAGKTEGRLGNFRYRAVESDGGTMYMFIDCTQRIETFQAFLRASVLVSAIGLALVFILVLIFSGAAVKPIAESYEKQKRFITDASHEIKTPLTIIDANTEILEMDSGENEWTKSIKHQVRRLTELTDKLVFLTRMDEKSTRLAMAEFSLSDAVEETAEPYYTLARSKGKTFTAEIESGVSCLGSEENICRALTLLLDNAIKYSSEGGSIGLKLFRSGKNRIITVYNDVDTIEKGKHNEYFERFYRSDESRNSETGGHGIGLSVVRSIVTAHKGKISAYSEDGRSIVFKMIL